MGDLVQVTTDNSVSIIKEELDLAITTAKAYPRNIEDIMNEIQMAISANSNFAKSLWYAIPRDNRTIEGASVRLAELFLSSWGNIKVHSRIKEITDTYVVAEAIVFDMEKNIAVAKEARRKIIDKKGVKYTEDMIMMISQAAVSIAIRNALFTVIPRIYIINALNYAKEIATKHPNEKNKNIKDIFKEAVSNFEKLGLTKEKLLNHLGKDEKNINEEDINYLRGLYNALRDNFITIENIISTVRHNNGEKEILL